MGVCTKGSIFKSIGPREFLEGLKNISGLKVTNEYLRKNDYDNTISGSITLDYRGYEFSMFLYINPVDTEYVNLFKQYENGFEDSVLPNIQSFGKPKYLTSFSLGFSSKNVEIVKMILTYFGGVFIESDADDKITYIKGILDKSIIFKTIQDMPNILINKYIKEYLSSGDVKQLNGQLVKTVKGTELLREFAVRNVNR